ncbi:phage neck terminator protein [Achromobacter insolitus]|uniref:phage neck terminator protein n=1 Tax=Achromobacter insolitus TaxID=217204 RepID=UPI0013E30969|nr:hypothetical protein [Achromobacter insolitus]MCP1404578.1 hypothetical protein [Achromobacter insolitus]NGT16924.1 hypothetical protein [Achromobacter insolitus]
MAPEDRIFELIEAAAGGVPVIFADENGKRPSGSYIAMAVRWEKISSAEVGRVDDDGAQAVHQHDDATVELQGFGPAAYDGLDELALKLRHPLYEERAEALGLALYEVGRLQSIPVLRDAARFERRGVLELGIRYSRTHAEDVGFIETVTGTVTTTGGLTPAIETPFSATVVTAP